MKFGMSFLGVGPFSAPESMTHLAQKSEQCVFESLWMADHSAIPDRHNSSCPYTTDGRIPPWAEATPLNEPIAALSYIAALTSKVRAGTGVMILAQRHPFYVAKEVAIVDLVSRGRALLGIGSGWLAEEFDALGLDFHKRGKRTDEAIQLLRALWRDDPSSFKGEHFNFEYIRSFPKPVQKGGVPILIGGIGSSGGPTAVRSSLSAVTFKMARWSIRSWWDTSKAGT
jgi:probable F420-dependent oxidoreductase